MPFQVGGVSLHDDYQHTGSAARDVVDGVAGLDSSGQVLGVGQMLLLTRDGSDNIYISERTSLESPFRMTRVGPGDFDAYINNAGAFSEIQLANMRDVASGIALLGSGGELLAPGSDVRLTRDGSENIEVVERTSGDIVYRWTRIGVNDFECRINCGGVACKMLNDSLIDAVSGIAGLDANKLLDPVVHAVGLEEYSNHLGAVDNFTETATAGNGTANADAANHEMDLSSGVTVAGQASFRTKDSWALGAKPIVFNGIIQNIVTGAGGVRFVKLGLAAAWHSGETNDTIAIEYNSAVDWFAITDLAGTDTITNIGAVASGDIITIVATSAKVVFYVNGTVVATHTTNIPTNAMVAGMGCGSVTVAATTAISMSADMMGVKRYV